MSSVYKNICLLSACVVNAGGSVPVIAYMAQIEQTSMQEHGVSESVSAIKDPEIVPTGFAQMYNTIQDLQQELDGVGNSDSNVHEQNMLFAEYKRAVEECLGFLLRCNKHYSTQLSQVLEKLQENNMQIQISNFRLCELKQDIMKTNQKLVDYQKHNIISTDASNQLMATYYERVGNVKLLSERKPDIMSIQEYMDRMWMLLDVYDKSLNSMDNAFTDIYKQLPQNTILTPALIMQNVLKINLETAQFKQKVKENELHLARLKSDKETLLLDHDHLEVKVRELNDLIEGNNQRYLIVLEEFEDYASKAHQFAYYQIG